MNADQDPSQKESGSDTGANAISAPDIGALQAELAVQRDRCWPILTTSASEPCGKPSAVRPRKRKLSFVNCCRSLTISNARSAATLSTSPEQLRRGVQMTLQQLTQLLRGPWHRSWTRALAGHRPHYHEAVSVPARPIWTL